MDAKKQANELVGKIFNEMPTNLQGKKGFYTSKKIALISIESTIKALWEIEHSFCMEKIKELAKVKQEINKL